MAHCYGAAISALWVKLALALAERGKGIGLFVVLHHASSIEWTETH